MTENQEPDNRIENSTPYIYAPIEPLPLSICPQTKAFLEMMEINKKLLTETLGIPFYMEDSFIDTPEKDFPYPFIYEIK